MSHPSSNAIPHRPTHPADASDHRAPRSAAHDAASSWISAEPTRSRQTEKGGREIRRFALATAGVLVSGVQTGLDLVGAPRMAAAVRGAAAGAPPAALGVASGAAIAVGSASVAPALSEVDRAYQMQRESQAFNLQLLELQEQIQQENRQFTTVTNVMRAKHDTAKAALSNIRS